MARQKAMSSTVALTLPSRQGDRYLSMSGAHSEQLYRQRGGALVPRPGVLRGHWHWPLAAKARAEARSFRSRSAAAVRGLGTARGGWMPYHEGTSGMAEW